MAKKSNFASGVLKDVGGLFYSDEAMKERLASLLGVPPKVISDTLRGHGGLTEQRLLDLAESRALEMSLVRDELRYRLTFKLKKEKGRSKRGS